MECGRCEFETGKIASGKMNSMQYEEHLYGVYVACLFGVWGTGVWALIGSDQRFCKIGDCWNSD